MGEVLLAWDERLKRRVAVKRILKDDEGDPRRRERFRREAQAVAQLNHPSIVQIYDLVETDEGDHLVMEYVEGISLDRMLAEGPLDLVSALSFARDVAEGLGQAHGKGLIHRDLKPANVRIAVTDEGKRAKILDFGLARIFEHREAESDTPEVLTQTGALVGTVHAMSPEQAKGQPLDHRSDLFALGGLMYEMFAGEAPFRADTLYGTLFRIATKEPKPLRERHPEVTPAVESLVLRLLAKEPAQRPGSAWRVAEEIELLLEMVSGTRTSRLPSALPALGTVPRAPLRDTVRAPRVLEIPELLPYLSDRSRQRDQFVDAVLELRRDPRSRPLAVVIHGDERESHDAFVDRLQSVTLPKVLRADAEEPVRRERLRWSVPRGKLADRRRELERRLAELLTGRRDADRDALARAVASHRCTTMISVTIRSSEHLRHEPELLRFWLELFAAWPDLPPGQFLLPVLCLVDSHRPGGWRRLAFRRNARVGEKLAESLARDVPKGLEMVVLDRLESVREDDVHAWIEEHAGAFLHAAGSEVRSPIALRERLIPKVRRLFQRQGEEGLPMEVLALELRGYLEVCLQQRELQGGSL